MYNKIFKVMKKHFLLAVLLVCITSNAQEPNKSNVQKLIKEFEIATSSTTTVSTLPGKVSKNSNLLWDQNPGALSGGGTIPILLNFHSNPDDAAIIYADDFQLTSESEITKIKFFGTSGGNANNFIDNYLTGVDLYIYANSSDGIPSGDPYQTGTGLLEIVNLDPTSEFLEFEFSTFSASDIYFIFDIEAYNGGSPLLLPEGSYWVCFFPRTEFTFTAPDLNKAWLAYGPDSNITNTLSNAHYMDKDMIYGNDATTWTMIDYD